MIDIFLHYDFLQKIAVLLPFVILTIWFYVNPLIHFFEILFIGIITLGISIFFSYIFLENWFSGIILTINLIIQ